MRILAAAGLMMLAALGAPAFGQTLMKDFSWTEMRAELVAAGAEVTRDGASDDSRYLVGKDDTGLTFSVYGMQCDTKEITQRCTGADFVASFTLKDPSTINTVLDDVDYAALGDYKGDDGNLKISRYVIFDHGIARENLQVNIEVFLRLSNDIWDDLDDRELLK
jgi:hypothetical protein